MKLTEKQKRHLRGLAHGIDPCVHIGSTGVTQTVMAELDKTLAHHQLLKVKVRAGDRDARDTAITALVDRCGATLLTRIGNVAVLYRPNPENPRIALPD
jgi:RNA-binding protein